MSDTAESAPAPAARPTVKVRPTWKAGETAIHTDTGEKLLILSVETGGLRCKGFAGLIDPAAVEKP